MEWRISEVPGCVMALPVGPDSTAAIASQVFVAATCTFVAATCTFVTFVADTWTFVTFVAATCTFVTFVAAICTFVSTTCNFVTFVAATCTFVTFVAAMCTFVTFVSTTCTFVTFVAATCTFVAFVAAMCTFVAATLRAPLSLSTLISSCTRGVVVCRNNLLLQLNLQQICSYKSDPLHQTQYCSNSVWTSNLPRVAASIVHCRNQRRFCRCNVVMSPQSCVPFVHM